MLSHVESSVVRYKRSERDYDACHMHAKKFAPKRVRFSAHVEEVK